MIKRFEKFGAYIFFTLLMLASYYIVNLNTQLDSAINELVYLKSEDGVSSDRGAVLTQIELGKEPNSIEEAREFEEKSYSIMERDENLTPALSIERDGQLDDILEKIEPQHCIETISDSFFIIEPKLKLDMIINRYGEKVKKEKAEIATLSIKEKKERFINLVLPAVDESRRKLIAIHNNLLELRDSNLTLQDEEYLKALYKVYRIKNGDFDELLLSVKPHPISVILAQAALESGWGTSRFFKEGNNIFGIWSFDSDDERIKAQSSSDVYLKKYDSYVESVDDYMALLGRTPQYSAFRKARAVSDDPIELIQHLEIYSELREEYVRRLRLVIEANNFEQYDKSEEESLGENSREVEVE